MIYLNEGVLSPCCVESVMDQAWKRQGASFGRFEKAGRSRATTTPLPWLREEACEWCQWLFDSQSLKDGERDTLSELRDGGSGTFRQSRLSVKTVSQDCQVFYD